VSCSNDCATTESYTILLLESSYDNIPSCSWPNHSSDVVKWSSRGRVLYSHITSVISDYHAVTGRLTATQGVCAPARFNSRNEVWELTAWQWPQPWRMTTTLIMLAVQRRAWRCSAALLNICWRYYTVVESYVGTCLARLSNFISK